MVRKMSGDDLPHEKGPKDECRNYRTTSLIITPAKYSSILPSILSMFMPGRGTRDQLMNVS